MTTVRAIFFPLLLTAFVAGAGIRKACAQLSTGVGIGYPELINAGIRYDSKNMDMGVSLGTFPQSNLSLFALSFDASLHIGKSWKFLAAKNSGGGVYKRKAGVSLKKRSPWFIRSGLIYYREESELLIDTYYYMNLRAGWETHFGNWRFSATLGGVLKLLNNEKKKKDVRNLELEYPLLPAGGLSLYYRL